MESATPTNRRRIWSILGWICILVFLCWNIWYWNHLPTVGKGGLLLAVVATLMPIFWEKVGVVGKAAFVAMLFLLMKVEYRAIDKDRRDFADSEHVREERENHEFERIAEGLRKVIGDNQRDFTATVTRFDGIANNLAEIHKRETGGNSYLFFGISAFPTPTEETFTAPGGVKVREYLLATASPRLVGKYPLNHVYVATFCPGGWLRSVDYGTYFPGELGRPREGIYLYFPIYIDEGTCYLYISASNGSYQQMVHFFRQGRAAYPHIPSLQKPDWVWATLLYKYGTKKPLKVSVGPGFPAEKLDPADWVIHHR